LEDAIRAGAVDVDFTMWVTATLAAPRGETVSLGYPRREAAAAISPTAPACAPQDHLEPVLLMHLLSFPVADVRFDTELVTLEQDEDGSPRCCATSAAAARRSSGRGS
jgi:putative polyketide hydroxylase